MLFDPIQVIARRKKSGAGTHFGVLFPDGTVYDYTAGADLRQVTLEDFLDGESPVVVREIPWYLTHAVYARLEELRRNPPKYSVLQWNCETFAEWLTSGVARSAQVAGAILVFGVVVAIAFAARA